MDIAGEPPNIYFVLDHSGSMVAQDLWGTVSRVVLDTMRKIGRRGRFGAAMFPDARSEDQCAPGREVMSVRLGDPTGTYGPTWTFLHSQLIPSRPRGGTPTSATLEALRPTLTALPGKTFVVLATDGGPNCNTLPCTTDRCMANIEGAGNCTPNGPNCCTGPNTVSCLDADATESAVRRLRVSDISTYVIGVPGSGTYSTLLDALATSGGTARAGSPKYYRVDSAQQAEFSRALAQVVAKIVASCTISLSKPPEDPRKVNVYLDEAILSQAGPDGWTLDGQTVTLEGASCQKVLDGEVLDVRVVAGCKTFNPK
jgi:hypothetical protein